MKINLNESEENNSLEATKSLIAKENEVKPKIRPLASTIKEEPKRNYSIYVLSILILISAVFLYPLINTCEFKAEIHKKWNLLVNGDEYYCIRKINTDAIFEDLKYKVVAQDDALELIKGSLNKANRDDYVNMAFNGLVGVGKSLSADIISNKFRWTKNIQKIAWDGNSSEIIEKISSKLSKCGFNLVIIDNMDFNETSIEFVKEVGAMIQSKSKADNYRTVFLAIFNGMLENDTTSLQEMLKNFVIIDFNQFTLKNFMKCIEVHQKLYNIKLTEDQLDELKNLDFISTGCKLISKRLK